MSGRVRGRIKKQASIGDQVDFWQVFVFTEALDISKMFLTAALKFVSCQLKCRLR